MLERIGLSGTTRTEFTMRRLLRQRTAAEIPYNARSINDAFPGDYEVVEIRIEYQGELHCEATHGPSGCTLTTDAPVDNQGRGESFSPTDLVATALGTCVATIMGIYAQRHDLNLQGMQVRVEKHMSTDQPRRIMRLPVTIEVPIALDERHRRAIETAAGHCPVHQSLRADIEAPLSFAYPD